MKPLVKSYKKFETNRMLIYIYSTDVEVFNEPMYIIITKNKITCDTYVRYGNLTQVESIINTYKMKKEFAL